jgi:hypothetical protein
MTGPQYIQTWINLIFSVILAIFSLFMAIEGYKSLPYKGNYTELAKILIAIHIVVFFLASYSAFLNFKVKSFHHPEKKILAKPFFYLFLTSHLVRIILIGILGYFVWFYNIENVKLTYLTLSIVLMGIVLLDPIVHYKWTSLSKLFWVNTGFSLAVALLNIFFAVHFMFKFIKTFI